MIKKKWIAVAKYPIALLILYFVLRQADWHAIVGYAQNIPLVILLLVFALFTVAQCLSAARMNLYYRKVGKPLHWWYNVQLYYVGLVYNILLPGGIGGDAYKIYLLKRQKDYPVGEGVRIQLATRGNGLLVLLLSAYAMLPFIDLPLSRPQVLLLVVGLVVVTVAGYVVASRLLLKDIARIEWSALPYSVGVQGLNVLCMTLLWANLTQDGYLAEYILLFQLAAIAGMIPITIGGLGIRELTFFYGAQWISHISGNSVDGELGVVISLLMFAITVMSAVIGLRWLHSIGKMNPCGPD